MAEGFPDLRVCTGPSHPEPTALPLGNEHWYFHKSGALAGRPVARCKACQNWSKLVDPSGPHGWVEVSVQLRMLAKELQLRCGSWRLRYHHGLHRETLRMIVSGERTRVQKKTVVKILVALSEQRRLDRLNGHSEAFRIARIEQIQREENLRLFGRRSVGQGQAS